MEIKELFEGVFLIDGKLATENMVKGSKAYSEELLAVGNKEYRLWNPYRSKLSAAIMNGMKNMHIKKGSSVLYLGAATGTTASHVSDIVGPKGSVYCIELSDRNMRQLLGVCEKRRNMLPILGDAGETSKYSEYVGECDVIYQDVSARDQSGILLENSKFLKKGGFAYFIIKSQSVDVSKKPSEVFESELSKVSQQYEIVEKVNIEPYDELHMFAVLRKR
ncbi:MAG: fibrillarin-like rRNA/tRNA 2'-O-methyltransferase [Candidatus Marsarchaeota archaeon]|nr:fibrillarin-like rRNA/tRNA 2'-O-methyltransferase [Candidatus Marsarchaeota archaeon]MCL5101762.1 fibrillarin-like rRNA/tRNA 2'-O-methyltransferase [Candidatus Marsarchaeota archaeon]